MARNQRGRVAIASHPSDSCQLETSPERTREEPRRSSHDKHGQSPKSPRHKQSRPKRCKTLSLKSLHLTAARTNLNGDAGTREGNKTSAQSAGCQRTPAEGEGRQLVADVGPPSRKTFNIVLRPSHVRAEETKGVNEDVKQGTAMGGRPAPVARGIASCWHGDACPWHKRGLCFFGQSSTPPQIREQTAKMVKMIPQERLETVERKLRGAEAGGGDCHRKRRTQQGSW